MTYLLRVIIVIFGLLTVNQGFAKGKKIKFGKVDLKDLEMTTYSNDTSAPAIILSEIGYYNGNDHQFYLHKRIKILKKEGTFMADNEFVTGSKGSIKGYTFNLENGEVIKTKLQNDNIFEEKIWDNNYIYNVAMPDVKVGSIIDIEVKYNGFPIIWYFQSSIPVVHSELELGDSQYLSFRKQISGLVFPQTVGHNHWKAENVPAFITESFTLSDKNYLSRIDIDVYETHFPGYYPLDYASTWVSVQSLLNKFDSFGKTLGWPNLFLNKYAKTIEANASTDAEKAKLAVETIKSITDWNNKSRLLISKNNLGDVADEKTGNSADINLMLIDLLEKLKFEVYPMVMSTRKNGMLHPINPTLSKLNYVVAYTKVDGKFIILDATSDYLPWDMLPIRCLNYGGQVFDNQKTKRVNIMPSEKFSKTSYYNLKMDDNLTITGNLNYKKSGYAAYDFRTDYSSYLNDQDYVDYLIDNNNGLSITDFSIEKVDILEEPISEKYSVEIEDAITVIDGQAYINMFLYEQLNENPFKSATRQYPVDFAYAQSTTGVVRLEIPENYTVAELPTPVNISMPNNEGSLTVMYQSSGNVITLNYKLIINKTVFAENKYALLKEFYSQVVNNHDIPVIVNLN